MAMRSLIPGRREPQSDMLQQDPFWTLRNEMDRVFDSFRWPGYGSTDLSPRVDVSETDKELDIDAELPGLDDKDIDVTLHRGVLTIRGEKKSEREERDKNYRLSERSYGSFSRSIELPFDADPGKVSAKFEKGVLHIAIPKPPEAAAKSTKIPVKPG